MSTVSFISAEESQPSPLVAMLISGVKGMLVKYWILFCCSMFFVISFSGKVSVHRHNDWASSNCHHPQRVFALTDTSRKTNRIGR